MRRDYIVILCTIPDLETAKKIANTIVEEKLAACCNILPNITSVYLWKGNVENDEEFLIVIKSAEDAFKALEKRITELHPYEVPEIIALPINLGNQNYLKWIGENVAEK